MSAGFSFDHPLGDLAKLVICFDYDKGDPGCHTQRNGDPGWPSEPESVEITDVQVWKRADKTAPWVNLGISLDEDITDNDKLEQMCFAHISEIQSERED